MKLFLELSLYTAALLVLQGIIAEDDQEVEAWYLEGWCFFLMAEQAQENGGKLDELGWEDLARDARDCLETCQMVCPVSTRDYGTTVLNNGRNSCMSLRSTRISRCSSTSGSLLRSLKLLVYSRPRKKRIGTRRAAGRTSKEATTTMATSKCHK